MHIHSVFMAYWPARVLMTGVELGVFDQLAAGPQTARQVAEALRLDSEATGRLLDALVAMGFVARQGAAYTNTSTAALGLVKGSPMYAGGIAHHHAEQLWPLWSHLSTAVREGRPVLQEAFGGDRNPFSLFGQSPEGLVTLLAGMEAGAKGLGEAVALAHDFR